MGWSKKRLSELDQKMGWSKKRLSELDQRNGLPKKNGLSKRNANKLHLSIREHFKSLERAESDNMQIVWIETYINSQMGNS